MDSPEFRDQNPECRMAVGQTQMDAGEVPGAMQAADCRLQESNWRCLIPILRPASPEAWRDAGRVHLRQLTANGLRLTANGRQLMGSSGVNRRGAWLRLVLVQPGAEFGEGLAHRPEVGMQKRPWYVSYVRRESHWARQRPIISVVVVVPVSSALENNPVRSRVGNELFSWNLRMLESSRTNRR